MFYRLPLLVILLAVSVGYGQDLTPCSGCEAAGASHLPLEPQDATSQAAHAIFAHRPTTSGPEKS